MLPQNCSNKAEWKNSGWKPMKAGEQDYSLVCTLTSQNWLFLFLSWLDSHTFKFMLIWLDLFLSFFGSLAQSPRDSIKTPYKTVDLTCWGSFSQGLKTLVQTRLVLICIQFGLKTDDSISTLWWEFPSVCVNTRLLLAILRLCPSCTLMKGPLLSNEPPLHQKLIPSICWRIALRVLPSWH